MKNIEKYNKNLSSQIETICDPQDSRINELAVCYATDYWAGSWKELLVEPNSGVQFGTYDQNGNIYPETRQILEQNGISPTSNWPQKIWQAAGARSIFIDGIPVRQYWTLDSAIKTLRQFIEPIDKDGYGGKIMTLTQNNQILGFTSYTVANEQSGPRLAKQRFPYENLDLQELIKTKFPGFTVGIFLDFAISESSRGQGYGSYLFDARLNQMVNEGAQVIVGRTIRTSPAQYYGNYIARGMEIIADDPQNPDKKIFAVTINSIKPRKL